MSVCTDCEPLSLMILSRAASARSLERHAMYSCSEGGASGREDVMQEWDGGLDRRTERRGDGGWREEETGRNGVREARDPRRGVRKRGERSCAPMMEKRDETREGAESTLEERTQQRGLSGAALEF